MSINNDMTEDMESNEKNKVYSHRIVFKRKKLIISLVFISQSDFKMSKTIRTKSNTLSSYENS